MTKQCLGGLSKPEPNALASGAAVIETTPSRPEASAYGSIGEGVEVLKRPRNELHAFVVRGTLIMAEAIQVATTTADRADAERIAAALVAKRLAACVHVSGPIEATYRWKGQMETSQEWVCTIKTCRHLYGEVEQAIRGLHSYEEPEIVALPIVAGSESYLGWLADSVKPETA